MSGQHFEASQALGLGLRSRVCKFLELRLSFEAIQLSALGQRLKVGGLSSGSVLMLPRLKSHMNLPVLIRF